MSHVISVSVCFHTRSYSQTHRFPGAKLTVAIRHARNNQSEKKRLELDLQRHLDDQFGERVHFRVAMLYSHHAYRALEADESTRHSGDVPTHKPTLAASYDAAGTDGSALPINPGGEHDHSTESLFNGKKLGCKIVACVLHGVRGCDYTV